MKSTSSVLPRSFCANSPSVSRTVWPLLMVVLSLVSVVTLGAATQTFWPFNSFPPPTWSFSSSSGQQIAYMLQGGGFVIARNFVITNLNNPIILPALGASATNNTTVRMDCELSYDYAETWQPFSGNGDMSLVLSHTNDTPGVRMFRTEMLSLNTTLVGPPPGGGPPRIVMFRESALQASLGQLVVTATNGGYFFSSFVDVSLEMGQNFGAFWSPGSNPAHLELSGPPGVAAVLSISRTSASQAMICWSTQTNGQYQLQRKGSVAGGTWTSVGAPLAGTSSNLCVIEAIAPGMNQFYRVQLSP